MDDRSVFKEWRGMLRRVCVCGEPYEARAHYKRGENPRIIPVRKTCAVCGRYLKDAARRRRWRFDPHYERGDSWS